MQDWLSENSRSGHRVILATSRRSTLGARCAEELLSAGVLGCVLLPPKARKRRNSLHVITFLSAAFLVLVKRIHCIARWLGLKRGLCLSINEFLVYHREVYSFIYRKDEDMYISANAKCEQCDILLCCGYPYKIQESLLSIQHALNLHPGSLPEYKGPNPLFWALYHKKENLFVTLHKLSDRFDSGDIVAEWSTPIDKKSSEFGAEIELASLVSQVIPILTSGTKIIEMAAKQQGKGKYYTGPSKLDRKIARRRSVVRLADAHVLLGIRKKQHKRKKYYE